MNPIVKRVITALGTATAVVGLFLYCPLVVFAPLLVVISALVQLEFYMMVRTYEPLPRVGILMGTLWLAITAAYPSTDAFAGCAAYGGLALAPLFFIVAVRVLFTSAYTRPLATLASTFLGVLYVPFLLSFFLRFVHLGAAKSAMFSAFTPPDTRVGLYTLLALVAITKLSDMGGFAFGMLMGRHKMCPAISPKKSWEGFVGSIVGSVLMALGFRAVAVRFDWAEVCPFWDDVTIPVAIGVGCAVATLGTLGDLIESRFKRECGVKDSATFMPAGMGGFLDMFDSVLFMPALFYPVILMCGK